MCWYSLPLRLQMVLRLPVPESQSLCMGVLQTLLI